MYFTPLNYTLKSGCDDQCYVVCTLPRIKNRGKKHMKWFIPLDLGWEDYPFIYFALGVLLEKFFTSIPTYLASCRLPVTLVNIHFWFALPALVQMSFSFSVSSKHSNIQSAYFCKIYRLNPKRKQTSPLHPSPRSTCPTLGEISGLQSFYLK